MFRKPLIILIPLILVASLAACGDLFGPARVPTVIPTVTAIPLVMSASPSTTSASIPTATQPLPATQVPAGPTAVPPTTAPIVVLTPTSAPQSSLPTPHGDGNCSYVAKFLGDVTIPDNTIESPGASFAKTWRVRNDGTCSWGTAGFALHSLIFVGGDSLGAPSSVQLSVPEVGPGDTLDISVPMKAPTSGGTYRSEWMLQVDNGPRVGVGAGGITPLYVQIFVNGSASPVPGLARITFEPGATESSVQGALQAGQSQDFILFAGHGQTMMLTLSSSANISLSVLGALGINPQVIRASPSWVGLLPADEDYIIHLTAIDGPANYGLNITIPQRITFAPGAIQGTVSGVTSARRTVTFLLRATAGQMMTATLTAPVNSSGITIYGLTDGIPLVRAVSGATSWSGQLPGSQDYVIEVVPAVGDAFSFSLQVTVQ